MRLLYICLLLAITGSVFSQDSIGLHYKIYDTRSKQLITVDKIAADMATADVLFFGEIHDDSVCHYLENKIFRALYEKYNSR